MGKPMGSAMGLPTLLRHEALVGVTTRARQNLCSGRDLSTGSRACTGDSRAPAGKSVSGPMAEPSARFCHIAAGVEGKVYVWGGTRAGVSKVSHDGPDKAEIIFGVDILDVKVSRLLYSAIMKALRTDCNVAFSSSAAYEFDVVTSIHVCETQYSCQ